MRVNEQIKRETRSALLRAGAEAFAARGYEGVSIDSVSRAAGLGKGTVYNYFPSKRAVFEAVLGEACALAAASAEATPDGAPTRARLEAFVAGNLGWALRNEGLAKVFARELITGEPSTKALILDAAAPCVRKVSAILEAAGETGELALAAPPAELALTFMVLANALLLQALQAGGGWPSLDALPTTVAGLFLEGIAFA
jgi:AcrR family transcriptional regulator